jgi:hypothetical protein
LARPEPDAAASPKSAEPAHAGRDLRGGGGVGVVLVLGVEDADAGLVGVAVQMAALPLLLMLIGSISPESASGIIPRSSSLSPASRSTCSTLSMILSWSRNSWSCPLSVSALTSSTSIPSFWAASSSV